jgi:2-methylisocitrate lyase-like PEP mutase family enzyme
MTAGPVSQRADFAALHRPGDPFLLPNAWDAASALLMAQAGFPAVGTTSLGVTASAGLVDGAGTGRAYTMAVAAAIVPRLAVPVTVDVEAGYSEDPGAVAELAAELARLGAAGINLEDAAAGQSGRLRPPERQAEIIRAVVAAAPRLFVNARTDTYWLGVGPPARRLDDTITRLRAYADAGASGVFVPGLTEIAAVARVTGQILLPLNVLWRPDQSLQQLGRAGVARVSTGSALYRRALAAGLATAVAARDGSRPLGPDVSYHSLVHLLAASVPERVADSTPDSDA